jgi:hypothetical protein
MDLTEIGCEDERWVELAEDRVRWWALVIAVLNCCVLLPDLLTYLPIYLLTYLPKCGL